MLPTPLLLKNGITVPTSQARQGSIVKDSAKRGYSDWYLWRGEGVQVFGVQIKERLRGASDCLEQGERHFVACGMSALSVVLSHEVSAFDLGTDIRKNTVNVVPWHASQSLNKTNYKV